MSFKYKQISDKRIMRDTRYLEHTVNKGKKESEYDGEQSGLVAEG